MIAKDIVDNAAIGRGGEKAYDFVRLRTPVENIAKNLDTPGFGENQYGIAVEIPLSFMELARQTEILLQVLKATGQIASLEQTLNQNLRALAGSKNSPT